VAVIGYLVALVEIGGEMARTVEVTPDHWVARGEAVVHEPGLKPLLVWGGIPGERARVRLNARGAHQVRGEWVSSETPDPHRVEPPCDRYSTCGGCALMHLDSGGQAAAREDLVRRSLAEVGLSGVTVLPLVPCPDGLVDYRHVVKVGFGYSETGRIRVGAWGRHSREIVPIPACNVATPVLRKVMVSLAHHTIALGIEPFDAERGRGVLRSAVLRASRATGEVLVTLIAARKDHHLQDLAEELARGVPAIAGIWLHLNDGVGNSIFVRDDQGVIGVLPLVGKEWIEERLGEVLYQSVLDRLAVGEGDAVIDLYCGVGGLALSASKRGAFALGIEEVTGAVKRAREAGRVNRVSAEFLEGGVGDVLPDLRRRLDGVSPKVVVDPARRGLEPGVVEAIVALEPTAVAYVSCNPTAMARDLRDFAQHGYATSEVIPFDMFPNTPHVECIAILAPPGGAAPPSRRAPKRVAVRSTPPGAKNK
jgi:23S rRNA (uracil1939-C5)-methyltransferase